MGIKGVDLEDKIFVLVFYGFPNCLDVRKGRKLPYAVYIIFQLHVTFAVCSAGEIWFGHNRESFFFLVEN